MSKPSVTSMLPGQRFRTGGTTFEVIRQTDIPADVVPVTPQDTKLLKVACSKCGYTVRVTQRWITKSGTPICPEKGHGSMERAEARTKRPVVAVDIETPEPIVIPIPEPAPLSKLAQLLETE